MQVHADETIQTTYRHTTPYYDVVVLTSPVRIESLAVDPSGRGWHVGVINNYGRFGSGVFASYGSFSDVEPNGVAGGRPEEVHISDRQWRFKRIPVGTQGLLATWMFVFAEKTFDIVLDWTVERSQAGLWEAGWKLDGAARSIGDEEADNLPRGVRGPYATKPAAYVAWSEADCRYAHTLVAAFVPGSADRGDQVVVEPNAGRPVTWAQWATVWSEGGTKLAPGTWRGGRWRIGASGKAHDDEYARALAEEAAGGPTAVPDPGVVEQVSERDAAVVFARQLPGPPRFAAEAGGGATVGRGPDDSWLLADGQVMVAFVPDGHSYKALFYAARGDGWQVIASAGPTRRFTAVSDGGDGGLIVKADGIGPDGTVQTKTTERWRIRPAAAVDVPAAAAPLVGAKAAGCIHIQSTDTPTSGHTVHPLHTYLAYPGGQTKHEIPAYDVLASPLLRPQADLVVGQRALWAPAAMVQHGDVSVALIPDLLEHRLPGRFAAMPGSRYFGLTLDLDVADRTVDGVQLGYGWRAIEGVYGYYYRDTGATPKEAVTVSYDLVLRAGAAEQSVVSDVQWRMWQHVGRRYFEQSVLPQTQPADDAFNEAWSHWERLYDERIVDGQRRGAVRIDREFPPDAMFMSWFNALRTSYGLYSQGRARGDDELMAKGRATLDLLLSAPQEQGAFPTIAGFRPNGFTWYASQKNFIDQMPWGPTAYATFDMGWAAYWVLRWYEDLITEPRALDFARSYGDFVLRQQLANGAVPSWIAQGTLTVLPYLRESAQTAASVMFLAELAKVTGEARYVQGAKRAANYVRDHHLRPQRWNDFEPYYSNALKAEGAADPFSGQATQNTLSMHFAALGLLTLYELTGDEQWLLDGQRAVDAYLQYQYVTPGLGLSLNSFGGFAVQNTDNEAVDARQSQFGMTLLDYARVTGRADYAQRGIAALRAGYATMASPTAEPVNPGYFDAYPVGRGPENYAHATYDGPAAYTAFDWGQGSAAAGFAEARNRFGDVWVDGRWGFAWGIDNVLVNSVRVSATELVLELTSPAPEHIVLLKAFNMTASPVSLRVNGRDMGTFTDVQLAAGVAVETRSSLRIVHNPLRTDAPVAGTPLTIYASVSHTEPVQQASVHYRIDDGNWFHVAMQPGEADAWHALIPASAIQSGKTLQYYITAATATASATAPEIDPAQVPYCCRPVPGHVLTTATYRAIAGTGCRPGLLCLAAATGPAGRFRAVMGSNHRAMIPFVSLGTFGATHPAGSPDAVRISEDGRQLHLLGIRFGDAPISADWTMQFYDDSFDVHLVWHVHGPTPSPIWEMGWAWPTLLRHIGDPEQLERETTDVRGFTPWVMAHDGQFTLVAAYRAGSAWSEANRYFHGSAVLWQSLWRPGGCTLPPGTYEGGVWRVGFSSRPSDTDYAWQLHEQLNADEKTGKEAKGI